MKVTKPTKFLALFDIHIGWERVRENGREVVKATHSIKAIKAALKFAHDYKPDAIIFGGDQLNCGPISHWLKGKPRLTEGFNLKKELDEFEKLILVPIEKLGAAIKVWHTGNHEVWIQDFIDQNPGTKGLLEPEIYLRLKERGYKIYDQGQVSTIGKLNWCHGDIVLRQGNVVNPARTLVNAYRKNIRGGHLHTYSAAIDTTLVDAKDFHSGIIVPSLSSRNPAFIKNNPNCFVNGINFGTVFPGGDFTDYVAIINNGKFEYGGKLYDGNR